jgi:hypothetical protein
MTALRRQSPNRLRAIIVRGAAVAACGTLAAACGSTVAPASNTAPAPAAQAGTQTPSPTPRPTATSGNSTGSSTGSTGTSSAGQANINLTVTGGGQTWTLRCEPPSGNVPDPQAACESLLSQPALFSTSPRHVMCPQIMGDGPGYLVSGTFLGQNISKAIMDGGCDLGKWSLMHNIFK